MRSGRAGDTQIGTAAAVPKRAWFPKIVLAAIVLTACSGESRGSDKRQSPSGASTTVVEAPRTMPRSGESTATPSTTPQAPPTNQAMTTTPTAPPTGFAVRTGSDGDTLTLVDGRRVRLAQVDAPEAGECFGSQSTSGLRALVDGRDVTLRRPANGPEKDHYGRTLAEVSVAGLSVNEQLVRNGDAEWYEEFAREDADLAKRLRSSELEAKTARRGLWAACATRSVGEAPPTTSQPVVPPRTNCHPAYPDDCIPPTSPDLDCHELRLRVRVDHSHGDPHRLDANQDGWGCESYGAALQG